MGEDSDYVTPCELACQVRIVCGGAYDDNSGGSSGEVAHIARQVVKRVSSVREGMSSLKASVGVKEEVPVQMLRHATIDDSAVQRICGTVGFAFLSCIEARIVSLADDLDR
ncbi:hypothetical protein V490_08042 [Pseudogymnoascus sp. VKM F-3557]|nr:hypothetical protein V490_08042 [Pseudogymnoascus sp. VKM F-3557]